MCVKWQRSTHTVTKHSSDNVAIPYRLTTFKMKGRGEYHHVCSLGSSPPSEDMVVCVSITAITNNLGVGLLIQLSVPGFDRTCHRIQWTTVF
jgi:hypothetical protein